MPAGSEGGQSTQEADTTSTNGTAGQEPAEQNGKSGQESGAEQQGSQSTTTDAFNPETIEDPALKAWATKVAKDAEDARKEAAKHRVALRDREAEIQRQNETEAQRQEREATERQERLDALEKENRDLKVNGAVTKAATDARAYNPATVLGLIGSKVELDDTGTPKNLPQLLTDLRKSDPYLFKAGQADAGEGTSNSGAPTGGGMNALIRQSVNARKGR